jgi:hypothetical protein
MSASRRADNAKNVPEPAMLTTNDATAEARGLPEVRPGVSGLILDNAERWSGLALGLAELVTGYSQRTLEQTLGEPSSSANVAVGPADVLKVLPGATAALALRLQHAAFDQWARVESTASSAAEMVGLQRVTDPLWRQLHAVLAHLDDEFKAEQSARAELAQEFLAAAGPQTLQELLSRVDLDALLAGVDLEAVLDRVDLDALLERVDLDAVLDRVDLDRVADRIDLERLLERVDVNELAAAVIADVEVAGLLRDGTGAIANSTVGVIRSQVEGVSKRLTRRPGQ